MHSKFSCICWKLLLNIVRCQRASYGQRHIQHITMCCLYFIMFVCEKEGLATKQKTTCNMYSHTSMISPDVIHPNLINTTSEMGTAMNTHSTSKAKTSTYDMSIIQLMHRPQCTSIVSQLKEVCMMCTWTANVSRCIMTAV